MFDTGTAVFPPCPCFLGLDCYEVSIHGWLGPNLVKIGEIWGKVICFDSHTSVGESFESAKILPQTSLSLMIGFAFLWMAMSMIFMSERLAGMLLGYGMLSRRRRPLCLMLMTDPQFGIVFFQIFC